MSSLPSQVWRSAALPIVLGLIASGSVFRAEPQGQTPGSPPRVSQRGGVETRAFLIVKADLGIYDGKLEDECPQGFEMTVEELYLATKTAAERERLLRPENAKEYANGWKNEFITGPGGENVCNNPKSFLTDPRHAPYRGVKGKVAYGLNLDGTTDGRATANTCAHPKFDGEKGEPAIDNQLYRAIGCKKQLRTLVPADYSFIDPFVVEIRGIGDPKNDDHVEVGIYSTDDVPIQGSDGKALSNQTLGITQNPRWRANVAGRIVNGQLTTDRVEAINLHNVLPTWGAQGTNYDFEFHGARLKTSLESDGTLRGVLAAYRPIENIFTAGRCCKGTASTANTDCASEHKTLALMADGYPDPDTGRCTMISSATNLRGIPVFLTRARELSSRK